VGVHSLKYRVMVTSACLTFGWQNFACCGDRWVSFDAGDGDWGPYQA